MKIWPLNGKFNLIDRGDQVQFVVTVRGTLVRKDGKLPLDIGDKVTLTTDQMHPGESFQITGKITGRHDTKSVYCIKFPESEFVAETECLPLRADA